MQPVWLGFKAFYNLALFLHINLINMWSDEAWGQRLKVMYLEQNEDKWNLLACIPTQFNMCLYLRRVTCVTFSFSLYQWFNNVLNLQLLQTSLRAVWVLFKTAAFCWHFLSFYSASHPTLHPIWLACYLFLFFCTFFSYKNLNVTSLWRICRLYSAYNVLGFSGSLCVLCAGGPSR